MGLVQIMRRSLSALVLLLFLSSALSGCLSNTDTTAKDEEEDSGTTPSQNGGLFCIEHDGLERCWEKHVPENLDPDVPVPLVVDVQGALKLRLELLHLHAALGL